MGMLKLTFDPPSDDMTMCGVDEDVLHETNSGPKLGSDLEVGDGLTQFGACGTVVIATIEAE